MNLVWINRSVHLHHYVHVIYIKWHAIEILFLGQFGWKPRHVILQLFALLRLQMWSIKLPKASFMFFLWRMLQIVTVFILSCLEYICDVNISERPSGPPVRRKTTAAANRSASPAGGRGGPCSYRGRRPFVAMDGRGSAGRRSSRHGWREFVEEAGMAWFSDGVRVMM
jgi:hypothetical protein